ncbi:MAG TPA: hypothetical protein VG247_27885 [Pseudonocardiaceae bacterium]|nr:hypothetical protein [Pseudonocardiaceae bacterium]
MNTEQEIQLSDDLRHLVANHRFQADPDSLLQRARQARRRGMATRGAAGIGVLAVAAAGAVIGFNGSDSGAGAPSVQDAAYVARQVSAALDSDANYVYRITDHGQGTVWYQDQVTMSQYWVYGSGNTRTEAWDSSPVIDHYTHLLDTTVNYKDRTYSTSDQKLNGYISGTPPKETTFVERTKESIGKGDDKVVGTGDYQGHHVIKLSYAVDGQTSQMWVDSTSYQPVYLITTDSDGHQDTSDLAFLPRTSDLLHTMNTPRIPAGFTKVADALGDGPGHGG